MYFNTEVPLCACGMPPPTTRLSGGGKREPQMSILSLINTGYQNILLLIMQQQSYCIKYILDVLPIIIHPWNLVGVGSGWRDVTAFYSDTFTVSTAQCL